MMKRSLRNLTHKGQNRDKLDILSMRMWNLKKIVKFSIIVIIGAVLGCELLLRLLYHEQLKTQRFPLIYQLDSIIGYSHIPNCKSTICIPSINKNFKLNSYGYYGTDFNLHKSDSVFRIAFIGNSVTEGIWLNGDENYPIILQKLFDDNGYRNVEVINCSYGGLNKDIRNYNLIRRQIIHYNADLVLFSFNFPFNNENEFRENYQNYVLRHSGTSESRQKAINQIENVENKLLFKFFYDVSYICRAYCKKFYENNNCPFSEVIRTYREKTSSAPDIIPYQYSYNTSLKLISELDALLAKQEQELIIFSFREDVLTEEILDRIGVKGFLLVAHFDESMYHKHDGHPNLLGQKEIARCLFEKLTSSHIISKQ